MNPATRCRASKRAQYRWLKARYERVADAVSELSLDGDERRMAQYFLALADCAAPSWQFEMEVRRGDEIDRKSGLIGGPLFTSVSHPWPSHEGQFATPIVQIDLDDLAALSGLPLGSGLLQVWAHPGHIIADLEVRIVGPGGLASELSAPPFLLNGLNYDCDLEIGDRSRPRWYAEGCLQIIGYDGPNLAVPTYDMEFAAQETADSIRDDGELRLAARLLGLDRLRPYCQYIFGNFAFGTFNKDTDGADEFPPILLCLGSDLPFWFSESGQIQVFFEFDADANVTFSARWGHMP